MSLFSPKKESNHLDLILEVESAVVRGSLVSFRENTPPRVMFTYSANISWKPRTDTTYIIKTTLKAVSEALDAANRFTRMRAASGEGPRKIRGIHFVLSSPWIVSEAKTVSVNFAKEEEISKSVIVKMISEEQDKLAPKKGEIMAIEQKIFDVRLNGYSVAAWQGKMARNLDVSFAVSVAGTRMIKRFTDLCSHSSHGSAVTFHSSLLLQQIGYGVIIPNEEDLCIVHIHGELTDTALVDRRITTFFGSYPSGVRTLVRSVSDSAKTDLEAADSLMALYVGGHLDKEHAQASTTLLKQISESWSGDLDKILSKRSPESRLPESFAISAWTHDDFFAQSLKERYPKSKIHMASMEDILEHVAFDDRTDRRRLSGIYVTAINTMNQQ